MEFIVSRDVFVQALTRVSGFVEKKNQGSVLSSVFLQVQDGSLRYVGTDKALTLRGSIPVTVVVPGVATVDAMTLLTTVKALPGDTASVKVVDGQRLEISSGNALFRLSAQSGSDYPVTPPLDQSRSLTIAADTFRRLLDQTIFSVAPDDNRYNLNGANFEQVTGADGGQLLRLVATDGNRLSWSQGPFAGELAVARRSLVPRKGLAEVRKLLEGVNTDVEIAFGERACVMTIESCIVHMRLVEADFPDYRQVLPQSFKRRLLVDTGELNEALKRVLIFATDSARSVRCVIDEEGITLSSRKLDAGESKEQIRADLTGDPVVMGFNGRFLQEVVAIIGCDRLVMELGDFLSPCVIKNPESPDCLFVVMPVRLD